MKNILLTKKGVLNQASAMIKHKCTVLKETAMSVQSTLFQHNKTEIIPWETNVGLSRIFDQSVLTSWWKRCENYVFYDIT